MALCAGIIAVLIGNRCRCGVAWDEPRTGI
jgi:hypothetical protein